MKLTKFEAGLFAGDVIAGLLIMIIIIWMF